MAMDIKTSATDMAIKPRYVTTPDAAIHLGLSRRTLENRCYGTGPIYRKLGGRVVYAIEDLEVWAELGTRRSTSDSGFGVARPAKHAQPHAFVKTTKK